MITGDEKKEPKVIGHPDLAAGASVNRGDILYTSIQEAIYRESRGENVEIHFYSTEEDDAVLADLRARARKRWTGDRLPDGWTRPLPPNKYQAIDPEAKPGQLSAELEALAAEIRACEKSGKKSKRSPYRF